jgi:hemerythrin HHE cation binding domain-containing protein
MTTESVSGTCARTGLSREDLTGFLLAHAAMRVEFGRLAGACREVRDAQHAELLESQIALALELLHHHHTVEDELVWPMLVERVPQARPALDALESQHEHIDPLIERAGDTRIPLAERATALQELHDALNAHLDAEERDAVPLIQRHLTRADWERVEERAARGVSRKRLPLVYGWLTSAGDAELLALAATNVPPLAYWLFRLFWWPSYRRRYERLYGSSADLPSSI